MSKIFKNSSGTDEPLDDVSGIFIPANGEVLIPSGYHDELKNSEDAVRLLVNNPLITYNDGTNDLSFNDAMDHMRGYFPSSISVMHYAFADKKTKDGKSLFARTQGESFELIVGINVLNFIVPWPQVKFDEIEIIGGEKGDKVTLKILDDVAGSYSGASYQELNEFGKNVKISKDFYKRKSNYDADLYAGMVVELKYTSVSVKTLDVNYVIHEVKA